MASALAGLRNCPWATCIHVFRRCYISVAAETINETHSVLDVDQDNVARIPAQPYQLDCHRYWGLRACCNICRVFIPWSFDHSCPLMCTVRLEYTYVCVCARVCVRVRACVYVYIYIYIRGGPEIRLHRDLHWSIVLPLLINPLLILHSEWNVGLYLWGRHNSHLVP
jgi:hypothetical protein